MNKIIAICGFSGSGKDTIAKYISEHYDYEMVISTTSRPMREGEQEGNPYHFVSKEEFLDLIEADAIIEHRSYDTLLNNTPDTWYYGIEHDVIKLHINYVVVLDLWGLSQFKKHFNNVVSFFIEVSNEERKSRAMQGRSDFDETEWNRRLADDQKRFTEKEISKHVNSRVPNLDFDQCISDIMKEVDQWEEKR